MKTLKAVAIVLFALFTESNFASAIETTSTGFYYPTGTSNLGNYAGWLLAYPSYPFPGQYHIGYDINADLNDAVYAISDGYVLDMNGPDRGWGANNYGVFIRHTLEDGSEFIALYGHVVPSVEKYDYVSVGDQIGTIGAYSTIHLHFGIHPGSSMPPSPYGMLPLPLTPPYNGWEHPIDWIRNHFPEGAHSASYSGQSPTDPAGYLTLQINEIVNCYLDMHNTGTATWSGDGDTCIYVELHSVNYSFNQDQASSMAYNWLYGTNYKVATTTGQVVPNGTGRYSFQIRVPSVPGTYFLRLKLYHPNTASYIPDNNAHILIEVHAVSPPPPPPPPPPPVPDTPPLVTGPGQMVMRDHITHAFHDANHTWFTTHYPMLGGDYGNTDPRVVLYQNGEPVTGYKEGNYLYIYSTYNSLYTYEADYPRKDESITYSYTYNGVPTFLTLKNIIGGVWSDSHTGVVVFKNGSQITAYKESGAKYLVTPGTLYTAGATYTAFYPSTDDQSYPGYVSLGPGQMAYKDKLSFAFQIGNTVWFNTYYSIFGDDYSATDDRVKIYQNGEEMTGYKEGQWLYITEGYNSSWSYEADYPRIRATLTPGYVCGSYRVLYAPSYVWGGTWGNTHSSVMVFKDDVQLEVAYKEVGNNLLVIPESDYSSLSVYTAEYVEVWGTGGNMIYGEGENTMAHANQIPMVFSLGQKMV